VILSFFLFLATMIDPILANPGLGPNDLAMAQTVEDWVCDRGPVEIPPYIMALGADRWKDREKQSRAIRLAGDRCFHGLVRGLHSRDAQVRLSCCLLLRDITVRHSCFPEQYSQNRYFGTSCCLKCGWYGEAVEIKW
jgi:hypothetical protein